MVVTDRTDLEKQFADGDARRIGDKVRKATNTKQLRQLLEADGSGLVFCMIQKYQQRDAEGLDLDLDFPTASMEVGIGESALQSKAAIHWMNPPENPRTPAVRDGIARF